MQCCCLSADLDQLHRQGRLHHPHHGHLLYRHGHQGHRRLDDRDGARQAVHRDGRDGNAVPGPERPSRANPTGRPSRSRGEMHSRTNTNQDRASRPSTSSSAGHRRRTGRPAIDPHRRLGDQAGSPAWLAQTPCLLPALRPEQVQAAILPSDVPPLDCVITAHRSPAVRRSPPASQSVRRLRVPCSFFMRPPFAQALAAIFIACARGFTR